MKKILVGLVIGLFLFGAAFAGVSDEQFTTRNDQLPLQNTESIEKTYTFDLPDINNEGTYVTVSMDNTKSIMQEGKPVLPYMVDVLRFPTNTKLNVRFSKEGTHQLKLQNKVEPYPMYTLLTTKEQLVVKEDSVYDSSALFPSTIVDSQVTVGIYNGERYTTLSLFVYPCQYAPLNNTLYYIDSITVTIDYTIQDPTASSSADTYDLIIITPDSWVDALQPLKQHKETYGVSTIIVGLNEIYGGIYFTAQGRDDAEMVKYFIKDAIEQWDTEYVLLVGGRQGGLFSERWLTPVRYSNLDDGSQWDYSYLSDLYFADIYKYVDGNGTIAFDTWDSNNDGVFAEWSGFKRDMLDMNPDVYLGRLACRTILDLNIIVDKIISYESTYLKDQDWFKRMVVVGGDTFCGYGESVAEGEISTLQAISYMDGFDHVKLYTSLNTLTGTSNVIDAINDGCGFLNFEGHGNPMGWSTHPPNDPDTWVDGLANSDMNKLSNDDAYPICVVGGCHNSQFNVSLLNLIKIWEGSHWYGYIYKGETAFKCWSWKLATVNGGGSIATIGCTGLGYGYIGEDTIAGLGGWIDSEFFRVYGQENKEILGQVYTTTLSNYVTQFPVHTDQIDCKTVQEWALLGDPTLMIGGYSL